MASSSSLPATRRRVPPSQEDESSTVIKDNIVFRSFRKSTSKLAYSMKKKISDAQHTVRERKTLQQLDESFSPQRFSPYPIGKELLKGEDRRFNTYRNTILSSPITPELGQRIRRYHTLQLDSVPCTPPSIIRHRVQQQRRPPLRQRPASTIVNDTESAFRRAGLRASKTLAKLKIWETQSPKRSSSKLVMPEKLQLEVNSLAQGLQELHELADKIEREKENRPA